MYFPAARDRSTGFGAPLPVDTVSMTKDQLAQSRSVEPSTHGSGPPLSRLHRELSIVGANAASNPIGLWPSRCLPPTAQKAWGSENVAGRKRLHGYQHASA